MKVKSKEVRRKLVRLFGFLAALAVFAFNFTPGMAAMRTLPPAFFIESGKAAKTMADAYLSPAFGGSAAVSDSLDETLGRRRVSFRLFGIIELASVPVYEAERGSCVPCGCAVGISIKTEGVMVVGFGDFIGSSGKNCCPARDSALRPGDMIITVNGCPVFTAEEMQLALNADPERTVLLIERDGRRFTAGITPRIGQDGCAHIGAWVRDSTVGIGTLSFISEADGGLAALGHAVADTDTGIVLPVHSGSISAATILGITRGRSGEPGELRGTFSERSPIIGSAQLNSELGVFGKLTDVSVLSGVGVDTGNVLPVAFPNEVHEGEASILAQISGAGAEKFSCRIIRASKQDRADQKGLVIEVTDPRLLEATGGIVQGMSGSPIIQDGRLAGVVTHVFVNDPLKGYGVYAYWMFELGKSIGD